MSKGRELLAPAGNLQKAKVAIQNGANAVYIGGKMFSARSSADNFSDEEIQELVEYATLRDAKVYLAVNTLMKEQELNEAIDFIEKMYNIGVNAFIFQDIGLATYVKEQLPSIEMHCSTQLFAHSIKDVEMFKNAGFSRVVLARELSLEEIRKIKENVDIELEVFVHGALCVCYSGQCLMSSLIGERSGNRGKCAQSCRMSYSLHSSDNATIKEGHLLSQKDIMAIEILEQYVDAGIDSFKIEGRMKNEKYVAQITSAYSEKLKNITQNIKHETIKDMQQIFNRGGYLIEGYARTYSGSEMMSIETPKSTGLYLGEVLDYNNGKAKIKLVDDVVPGDGIEVWTKIQPHCGTNLSKNSKANEIIWVTISGKISKGDKVYKSFDKALDDKLKGFKEIVQKTINAKIEVVLGQPLVLTLEKDEIIVSLEGDIVEKATKTPTSKEVFIEKLSKTGGTPYKLKFTEVDVDNNVFVNIKGLNELRRKALSKFEELEIASLKSDININNCTRKEKELGIGKFSVDITNVDFIDDLLKLDVSKITIPLNEKSIKKIDDIKDIFKKSDIELYLKLPKVTLNDDEKIVEELLIKAENILDVVKGFEICNYGEYLLVNKYDKKIVGDYSFTTYNNLTKDYLCNTLGFEKVVISPELNLKEVENLADKNTELIVYGKLEMMVTKQCPVGLYVSNKGDDKFCKRKGNANNYYLKDRMDLHFDLITNCDYCNCTILNSSTLYIIDKWNDIKKVGCENYRLIFTNENRELTLSVIEAHLNKDNSIKEEIGNVTNGHFYRGVL